MPLFVPGVLTAAQLNVLVNNLNETAPGKFTTAGQYLTASGSNAGAARIVVQDSVVSGTDDTTTSTTYTSLGGGTPSVGAVTGTRALTFNTCNMANNTNGAYSVCSYEVSSATVVAPSDTWACFFTAETSAVRSSRISMIWLHTGLTAGTNIFTQRYRVSGGTGTFNFRSLTVMPF